MNKKTKTWVSILVAVVIVVVLVGIAALAGTTYFFMSHIHQTSAAENQAADRFAREREKLSGRRALLELDERDEVVVNREVTAERPSTAKLQTLHALVYDPREERIVEVNIPFWLLRVMPSGRMSFGNRRINLDSTRVTVADLEQHGAGLILDHRDRRGSQVLVWTE
jgi:Tfp pilus assembly protein PilE